MRRRRPSDRDSGPQISEAGPADSAQHPYFAGPLPRLLAHRGLALDAPENSIEAFRAALAAGATHLETDVHATRDGEAVLMHDPDLRRLFGTPGRVEDRTLAELRQLDPRSDDRGTAGVSNGRVCTLFDALTALPEARFNIDVKALAAVDAVALAVRRTRSQSRVLITSFSQDRRCRTVRQLPGAATSASARQVVAALIAVRLGLVFPAARLFRSVDAVQIPLRMLGMSTTGRGTIRRFHRAGVEVHFWTVNEPAAMAALIAAGADGIVTDRVDLAVAALAT